METSIFPPAFSGDRSSSSFRIYFPSREFWIIQMKLLSHYVHREEFWDFWAGNGLSPLQLHEDLSICFHSDSPQWLTTLRRILQLQMKGYVQEIMKETRSVVEQLHGQRGKSFPKQNKVRHSASASLGTKALPLWAEVSLSGQPWLSSIYQSD